MYKFIFNFIETNKYGCYWDYESIKRNIRRNN